MAIRTTALDVGAIIEVDPAIVLTPFIAIASALVDQIADESGHDAGRLLLIETWLAAHFYTNRDPRTTSEKAGPVSASYQSAVALGLATSHYGQTAMILDTSGLLMSLSKGKRKVGVHWLGRTDEERLLDPAE